MSGKMDPCQVSDEVWLAPMAGQHPGNRGLFTRREALRKAFGAGAAIGALEFFSYLSASGQPLSGKEAGMARDMAQEGDNPHFLIYWYIEGGWESYDMFSPVLTPNNVIHRLPESQISDETYRVLHFGEPHYGIYKQGNIRYGYLAEDGKSLFPDMAVLSSMDTGEFHSGERLNVHMGAYDLVLTDDRQPDERDVMQAFAEVYGQPYVLPYLGWFWWLSDGELNEQQYTGRKGYYGNLGPPWAHTIYAGTPANLKSFLVRMQKASSNAVNRDVESFLGNVRSHLSNDSSLETVKSYASAVSLYDTLERHGASLNPETISRLFTDPVLRAKFDVQPEDELITYNSVNGNKARTKFTPAVNVQAMMTYEMMRAGLSNCFFIETRNIREFDSHYNRGSLWRADGKTPIGQPDQSGMMNEQLWKPLLTLVDLLKSTPYKNTGRSLFDLTTIVITSEFGRTIKGDVKAIQQMKLGEADKQKMINGQDISQHWRVTAAAFLGGNVKGNSQYGGVGERTLMPVPLMPDGSMDPAYHPLSGEVMPGRSPSSLASLPNHGDVYATALWLSGIDPRGRGRNTRGPLKYVKRV